MIVVKAVLIALANLAVVGVDLPRLIRRRQGREFAVVAILSAVNTVLGIVLATGVDLPSPTDLINALFGPLGRWFIQ